MASVLFIIRVPYEECIQSLEGNGQITSRRFEDQNFNEVKKFESDEEAPHDDCDAIETNQVTDDIEASTRLLNLTEVHESSRNGYIAYCIYTINAFAVELTIPSFRELKLYIPLK